MSRLVPILLLMLGGAAGTLARVGLAAAVQRWHGGPWPMGTLVVNGLGCLLFGTLWGLFNTRWPEVSPLWSLALLGGFCGAFTTFSTFAFETHRLSGEASLGHSFGYLIASNAAGLALIWLGAEHVSRLWPAG
jgi:CrcB protein